MQFLAISIWLSVCICFFLLWNPRAKPLQETIRDDTSKWREAIHEGGKVVTLSGLYTSKDIDDDDDDDDHYSISLFSIAV